MWYWCSKGINPNIAKQGILGSENTTVWNLELWGMIFCKDVQISLFTVICNSCNQREQANQFQFLFIQVGTPGCDLNKNLGLDTASWAITSDGTIQTNRQVETKLDKKIQEGDIIVGL